MNMAMDLQASIAEGQEDWAFSVGVQAYIWGLPIIKCWKYRLEKIGESAATRCESDVQTKAVNEFQHMRSLSTPGASRFVNSATDFLYSTAVLDLSAGPLMLDAPDFGRRWYGLQVLDPYMETLANLGTRTFGSRLPPIMIANRRHAAHVPSGTHAVFSDSDFVYVIGRIAAGSDEDLAPAHALQDGLALTACGIRESSAVATSSCEPLRHPHSGCPEELAFFEELGAVMKFVPPTPSEGNLAGLLGDVGLSVERGFDYASLPTPIRSGLARAVVFAQKILGNKIFEVGESINGWRLVRDIGNYGHNYMVRALVSLHGIWANVPEESLYFMARTDSEGRLLHGEHCYEIRFPAGGLPPVDAFWSISHYDGEGCLTENPVGKYTVNSLYNRLRPNSDGSVTVFISTTCPEPGMEENWLPSHNGSSTLTLRCYNPSRELLAGDYALPPLLRVR
ncbi:MAG: DUF1254 domain-containing protein [Pseudomonadota bacterium]|nr:DUF1254 domain-containing protein [Pseudomonadota bacterium]